jgi:NAD(P)-dependent dehydrogenase (short-subunit alcohol dehydrogenase family)
MPVPLSSSKTTAIEVAEANKDTLQGKHVIVTGANSGLGKETARVLASVGVHVTLTSRDAAKGEQAIKDIKKQFPEADCEVLELDLADLASVRAFADRYLATGKPIDVLIINAGVSPFFFFLFFSAIFFVLVMCPSMKTKDGFEMVCFSCLLSLIFFFS